MTPTAEWTDERKDFKLQFMYDIHSNVFYKTLSSVFQYVILSVIGVLLHYCSSNTGNIFIITCLNSNFWWCLMYVKMSCDVIFLLYKLLYF